MNHKYSTYFVLIFFFVFAIWNGLAELTSNEIDDVCAVNNSVLFKYNGSWGCGNLLDSNVFNITVNNITNIYNNYSLYSNQTANFLGNYRTNLISMDITNSSLFRGGNFIVSDVENERFSIISKQYQGIASTFENLSLTLDTSNYKYLMIFNFTDNSIAGVNVDGFLPGYNNTFSLGNNNLRWANIYGVNLYGNGSGLTNLPISNPFDQVLNTTSNVSFNRIKVIDNISSSNFLTANRSYFWRQVGPSISVANRTQSYFRTNINLSDSGTATSVYNIVSELRADSGGQINLASGIYSEAIASWASQGTDFDPLKLYGGVFRANSENATQTALINGIMAIHGVADGNRSGAIIGAETVGKNYGTGQGIGYFGYGQSGASGQTGLTSIGLEGFCLSTSGLCAGLYALPFTVNSKGFAYYGQGNNHFYNGNLYIYNTTAIQEAQNMSLVTASTKGGLWIQGYSEFESPVRFDGGILSNNGTAGITAVLNVSGTCNMSVRNGLIIGWSGC